jgi:hypothetical protein
MYQLSVDSALAFARKAIDELISTEDIGMLIAPDALNLQKLVAGSMVEAVMNTYANAPALLLNGIEGEEGVDFQNTHIGNGVVEISMLKPTAKILAVKSGDSDYIVSDLIPEDSAEGRKQLNKYARGVYDDPRLVLQKKWEGELQPTLKYYSLKDSDPAQLSFYLEYLPYPVLEDGVIEIPQRVEYAVLNYIVAHVLDSYQEFDAAEKYRAKAKELLA